VVVDAIDDAAVGFYERHGLIAVPDHPQRFYRRMEDVRVSLDTSESR